MLRKILVLDSTNKCNLWVPATEMCPPEKSWQTSIGFEQNLFNEKINIQIDGYYKKMTNLMDFGYGTFWNNAINWQKKSEKNGKGTSYGLELLINKKKGKLTGWVAYTYSKSTRQFENINSGNEYDYDFDRPHDFKIFGTYKISDNINISANWIFQSSRPINIPVGSMPFLNPSSTLTYDRLSLQTNSGSSFFYKKNDLRLKPYHRLDIAVNFIKEKKRGTRTWSISIYNVYNRQNPYYYYFKYILQPDGSYQRKLFQQSLFPIIPSISYSLKF